MKKLWTWWWGLAVVLGSIAVGCVSGDDGEGVGAGADGSAGSGGGSRDDTAADEPGGTGAQDASGDGGGANDEDCPAIAGIFEATYTEVSGSCGTVEGHERFPLDGGLGGVNVNIERRLSNDISTEVVLNGCTLDVSQTLTDTDGAVISQVVGEALAIESEARVSGYVSFTRYDPGGTQSCAGGYDIVLSKNTTLIGGAAGGDSAGDQSGTTGALWSAGHVDEIENDCEQTVMCRAQRGEPLTDDPLASCVSATSQLLDGDAARQDAFLASIERCQSFVVCQYVDCVLASM